MFVRVLVYVLVSLLLYAYVCVHLRVRVFGCTNVCTVPSRNQLYLILDCKTYSLGSFSRIYAEPCHKLTERTDI